MQEGFVKMPEDKSFLLYIARVLVSRGSPFFPFYVFRILLRVLMRGRVGRDNFLKSKYGKVRDKGFLISFLPKSVRFLPKSVKYKAVGNKFGYEEIVGSFVSRMKGKVFVDVGAYVGHYSILLSKNFRKCFAFEPSPSNLVILRQIVHYRKVKNVVCVGMAVSDKNGECILHLAPRTWGHSLLRNSKGMKVKTCTLASFFKDESGIDLVKVDVEGAEWMVLEGAEPILSKISSWVVELHDPNRKKELEEWFISRDYSVQWLDFGETVSPHIYAWRQKADF